LSARFTGLPALSVLADTSYLLQKGGRTILTCRVVPASSRNSVAEICDEFIRIKLTSPPVEGKANKSLIQFLGKLFKIEKRRIKIISGESSKRKRVAFEETASSEIEKKLKEIIGD